jgi:hypothetical protein
VQKLGLQTIKLELPLRVRNVDGTENVAGKIREKIRLSFTVLGRSFLQTVLVTELGSQDLILGIPWLEYANPDVDWKARILRWRQPTFETPGVDVKEDDYETPTYNLVISFIKGEATEETRQQWNKSRMNKAMLFAYNQDKAHLDAEAKKTLEEKVPIELHQFLSVFSDEEAIACLSAPNTITRLTYSTALFRKDQRSIE